MEETIKDKLEKVYRLVNSGATEGERIAAKKALDRLMERYNLDEKVLNELHLKEYVFKYATLLELKLLERIMVMMVPDATANSGRLAKRVVSNLRYVDWITIECAYEYFRRHMGAQWRKVVAPELEKCRKKKALVKRRVQLNKIFFSRYIIASRLYKEDELTDVKSESQRASMDRLRMMAVEGGSYNKQVVGGLLLESPKLNP
jgi:hypothetical protein